MRKRSNVFYRVISSFRISKRQSFVLSAIFLTVGMMVTQGIDSQWRYASVFVLSSLAAILSAFVLREDLDGIEWLTLLILPSLFTAGVALFYFLLPVRLLTRIPIAFLFALGFYALLLTENIYNVAAIRTIALLRAAHTVGFIITTVTAFFFFDTILTFHLSFFIQGVLIFLLSFLLSFQALWSMVLTTGMEERLVFFSFAFALIFGEIAMFLAFWPVTSLAGALFLTTIFYVLVGMGQRYLDQRLFNKEIFEFIIVGVSMFFLMFFSTKWGG